MTTISEIKAICRDAFRTVQRLPITWKPKLPQSVNFDMQAQAGDRAGEFTRYRVLPSGAQISESEKFFDALNRLEDEDERKLIYQWGDIKTTKSKTFRDEREKLGLTEHGYKTQINAAFQKVIVHFDRNNGLLSSTDIEHCEEIEDKTSSSHEARDDRHGPTAWSATPSRRQWAEQIMARTERRLGDRSPTRRMGNRVGA